MINITVIFFLSFLIAVCYFDSSGRVKVCLLFWNLGWSQRNLVRHCCRIPASANSARNLRPADDLWNSRYREKRTHFGAFTQIYHVSYSNFVNYIIFHKTLIILSEMIKSSWQIFLDQTGMYLLILNTILN